MVISYYQLIWILGRLIMYNKHEYAELHTIEWDILNSACRECYLNDLECNRYQGECRCETKRD